MAAKRRWIIAIVIIVISVLALVGAYFIVDPILRSYYENQVKQEITGNLPEGVTGDVEVTIGGASMIGQYLVGSFERVDLRAPALVVDSVPAFVHIVATDVPVDTSRPVGAVKGTIDLTQQALNDIFDLAGNAGDAELVLRAGEVGYTGTITLFGIRIDYLASATPTAEGDRLVLTPQGAEVTTGIGTLDVSGIVQRIVAERPITICVAQYLPDGVELTGVNVTPDRARITLESSTLMLTQESLTTLGSCSA